MDVTKTNGVVYPFAEIGHGINDLDAFDDAEVAAGILTLNAIRFSSFVPVGPKGRWKIDDNPEQLKQLVKGNSLPMAYKEAISKSKENA